MSQHTETRLVFSASCTGAVTLSQANIHLLGLCKIERNHCALACQHLSALIYLCTSKSIRVSQCLACVSKCHELKETVACLEMSRVLIIFIKRVSSCIVVFARSRTQVNMGISIEQLLSRIRYHDNFVKTKDASSRFNDRFGI